MKVTKVQLNPGERIDHLASQGVQIIQSSQVFAFSLDAVLLANFVRENRRQDALAVDLCAGNGAVGLFMHRRFAGQVVEVELQPRLAEMARRSVDLNHLTDRYRVVQGDVKQVYDYVAKDTAAVVVCNPLTSKPAPRVKKSEPLPGLGPARAGD